MILECRIFFTLIFSSHWCQSLLYQKLFNLRKLEVKDIQKLIADYNQKVRGTMDDFNFLNRHCPDRACLSEILDIYMKYAQAFL